MLKDVGTDGALESSRLDAVEDLAKIEGANAETPPPNPTMTPNLEGDPRLAKVFGDPVPPTELRIWAAMPPSRRDKVLQRVKALDRYCFGNEGLTANQAAADAGLKLGRFYQLARVWPDNRSLASVGTFASATGPRQHYAPDVVNALQAAVNAVVKETADKPMSVAALSRLLGERSGLPPEDLPRTSTLRVIVERELRRVRQAGLAGSEILFDHATTSLPSHDDTWHTVFLVIDRGTRMVLGHAIGDDSDSVRSYGAAASDAFRRITYGFSSAGIWAERLERSQIVPGADGDALAGETARIASEIGGCAPQVVKAGTYGRYAREYLGSKIGPIQLNAVRAVGKSSGKRNKLTELSSIDARARIELAVVDHNAAMLADFRREGDCDPPGELVRMLEMMASDQV